MRIHHRSPSLSGHIGRHCRPAFTLVELIVAISILAVLAGLALLIIPRITDTQRIPTAADRVQGQLFIAKQMALRDQQPRGVRLWQGTDPNNPYYDPNYLTQHFTALQLIEQPEPYATGIVTGVGPQDPVTGWYPVIFGTDPSTGLSPNFSNNTVQPGDMLDLSAANDTYCNTTPGAMHYITQVNAAASTIYVLTQPLVNPNSTPPPWIYRIIRSPRPMTGEKAVQLPKDVVVYLPGGSPGSYLPQDRDTYYDILFDKSGKLLRDAANQGTVILWVGDPTPGATAGGDVLLGIYSRTGVIAYQPVAPGPDPYAFIKNGATSGM